MIAGADALVLMGQQSEAVTLYEKALQCDAHNPSALLDYADLMHESGQFDKALPLYRRYVRVRHMHPPSSFAHASIVIIRTRIVALPQSSGSDYTRIVACASIIRLRLHTGLISHQIERNNAAVHAIIGKLFLRRRDAYGAAKEHFARALLIDPSNPEYQVSLHITSHFFA